MRAPSFRAPARWASLLLLGIALPAACMPAPAFGAGRPGKGFMKSNGTVTVGRAAPPVTGEDLDGKTVAADAFKGRPVLLDFGSIFCPNCQETLREMKRLEDAYRGTDLALVVVVDGETPVRALKAFFGGIGAGYTVIRGPDSDLFRRYGVDTIPFQLLIGRNGKIRKIHAGFDPGMEAAMGLKELFRKRTPGGNLR
ncbi:MAG TPA: TlpA disulfide reductase family protein [Candidatus Deferrimicrobiaceae bacterium]